MMLPRASPSAYLHKTVTSSDRSREFPDTSCSRVADGSRKTGGPFFFVSVQEFCILRQSLVVITGHGPQAEVAQVFGHELLVERGGGRLEGLEEEQRNGEEKETGEENNHHTTHR